MSSAKRDRRPLNPSSRLTSDTNAAEPLLTSHREGIALVQQQKALATASTQLSLTSPVDIDAHHQQSQGGQLSKDGSLPRSTSPLTPAAISQPGTIPPTSDGASEGDTSPITMTSTAQKKTRKRPRKHSGV